MLAREQPVDADVVVPVPDSGVCAAMGFAEESGIPLRMGLIRNHYVGRTFIQPQQSIRHFGVKVKLNPVRSILDGKRVVLVDDSIVRGTTSRKIVRMVRAAGAKEVHVRISCPPTISPCFYGVDTPRRSELIAATHTLEEIREYLDADSVAYLSLEGLLSAVGAEQQLVLHVVLHRASIRWRSRATRRRYLQLALKLDKTNRSRQRPSDVETVADDAALRRSVSVAYSASCALASGARRTRRRSPPAPQAVSAGAAAGGDRQARRSRLRHAHQRVAHRPPHGRRRRRCRRCCRRSPSTPTATCATARSCC